MGEHEKQIDFVTINVLHPAFRLFTQFRKCVQVPRAHRDKTL